MSLLVVVDCWLPTLYVRIPEPVPCPDQLQLLYLKYYFHSSFSYIVTCLDLTIFMFLLNVFGAHLHVHLDRNYEIHISCTYLTAIISSIFLLWASPRYILLLDNSIFWSPLLFKVHVHMFGKTLVSCYGKPKGHVFPQIMISSF